MEKIKIETTYNKLPLFSMIGFIKDKCLFENHQEQKFFVDDNGEINTTGKFMEYIRSYSEGLTPSKPYKLNWKFFDDKGNELMESDKIYVRNVDFGDFDENGNTNKLEMLLYIR